MLDSIYHLVYGKGVIMLDGQFHAWIVDSAGNVNEYLGTLEDIGLPNSIKLISCSYVMFACPSGTKLILHEFRTHKPPIVVLVSKYTPLSNSANYLMDVDILGPISSTKLRELSTKDSLRHLLAHVLKPEETWDKVLKVYRLIDRLKMKKLTEWILNLLQR